MRVVATIALIAVLSGFTSSNPAPVDLIRRAIDAVGGEPALRGLRTVVVENATFNQAGGQEEAPGMPAGGNVFLTRISRDRAGRRVRTDNEVRFTGFQQPNRSSQVATADGAMLVGLNGARRIAPPRAFQTQALNALETFMPVQLLRMLDQPDSVSPAVGKRIAGQMADAIRFVTNGAPTTVYFDRTSGLPLQVETLTDDPITGDAITTVTYSHWTRGAVRFPGQTMTVGSRGTTVAIQRVVSMNDAIDDTTFAIPDSIMTNFRNQTGAGATLVVQVPGQSQPASVGFTQVAPNVWRAAGPQYNAMVVEQPDRLVLVEAPFSAEFTQAILDTLAAKFPGKRVAWAVNTHHHWDHSSGVRTVLAAGIPVVTQARNVEFVRSIGTARKTVKPDAISRGRRPGQVIGVDSTMTLGSGDTRVELYAVQTQQDGGSHLVAYVPGPGVLFQSDILSAPPANAAAFRAPGQPALPKPAAAEILAIAQRCGMTIQQVIGGHGEVAPIDMITRAAQ